MTPCRIAVPVVAPLGASPKLTQVSAPEVDRVTDELRYPVALAVTVNTPAVTLSNRYSPVEPVVTLLPPSVTVAPTITFDGSDPAYTTPRTVTPPVWPPPPPLPPPPAFASATSWPSWPYSASPG